MVERKVIPIWPKSGINTIHEINIVMMNNIFLMLYLLLFVCCNFILPRRRRLSKTIKDPHINGNNPGPGSFKEPTPNCIDPIIIEIPAKANISFRITSHWNFEVSLIKISLSTLFVTPKKRYFQQDLILAICGG